MTAPRFRAIHRGLWVIACPFLLFPAFSPMLAMIFIGLLFTGRLVAGRWQGYSFRSTAIDGLLFIYLLLNTGSWLLSPLPEVGLSKLTVIILGWTGYYLAQDWLEDPAGLEPLITFFTLCGVGLMVAGLFVVEWPMSQQVIPLTFLYRLLPHLSGPFAVHRNEFAAAILLLLPFAWHFWRQRGNYLALCPLLTILAGLLLTQSRTALLGGLTMGGGWLLWGRFRWRYVLVGFLVVAGLLAWQLNQLEQFSEVLARLDQASKSDDSTSLLSRLEIWQAGLNSLTDYPVVGSGLYTFASLSRLNFAYRFIRPDFEIAHAHNLLLQEGLNLGWPGILLAVLLWGTGLALLWRVAEQGDWLRPEATLFGASLTGYLVFNLTDVLSLGHRPGLLIWFVLAGAMAVLRWGGQTGPRWYWQIAPLFLLTLLAFTPLLPYNLANLQLDRVRLGLGDIKAPLVAENLLGNPARLGWLAYLSGQPEIATYYWRQAPEAVNYFQERGFAAHQRRDFTAALQDYDFVLQIEPTNGLVHYWHGLIDQDEGRPEEALSHFEQAGRYASKLDERVQAAIFFAKGQLLVKMGDFPAGVAAIQQAITLDDSRASYYQWLGQGLDGLGDPAGAAAAYQQASQRENP